MIKNFAKHIKNMVKEGNFKSLVFSFELIEFA